MYHPPAPSMQDPSLQAAFDAFNAGRLAEADAAARRVLDRDPDDADAWRICGLVAVHTGRLPAGIEALARAAALRPAVPEFHYSLGNALRMAGKLDDAVESYRRALSLRPDYSDVLINL